MNDLRGLRFGKLVVLEDSAKRNIGGNIIWICHCDCGNACQVMSHNLKSGHNRSCGCIYKKHGESGKSKTRLYTIWIDMRQRIKNPNATGYKRYGGRGIEIYPLWLYDFSSFRDWALNSGYEDNLTIDRINNDGNYEPLNCQWITRIANSKKGGEIAFRI